MAADDGTKGRRASTVLRETKETRVEVTLDLDGGGRFLCQMTDANEADVAIGMPVELVLRRMREGAGAHHYYWKGRPLERRGDTATRRRGDTEEAR